jgi:hypothetical protein
LWDFCRARWEKLGYEIIECDSGQEPFTRGTSINRGVDEASHETLVIADADTFVSEVRGAVALIEQNIAPWVIDYGLWRYYRVSPAATADYLSGKATTRDDPYGPDRLESCVSYSGCVVLGRETFLSVGGFPETLLGWGYEDNCLQHALDTLVGAHVRTNAFAVQLYHHHVEAERFQQPFIVQNRLVSDRYAAATGNPEIMRAVILNQWAPELVPGHTLTPHILSDPPAWEGLMRERREKARG